MSARTEISAHYKLRHLTRRLSLEGQWRVLTWVLVLADATMLALAFALAYYLRFVMDLGSTELDFGRGFYFYTWVMLALIPTWLLLFLALGAYDEQNLLGGTREYALVFNGVSAGMLVVILATFLNPSFVIARAWLVYAWLLSFLFVSGERFLVRRAVYHLRGRGYYLSPTVIVGGNEEAISLARQLVGWRTSGLKVLGFVTREPTDERIFQSLYSLGSYKDLPRLVEELGVRELVVATSALSRPQLVEVFREFTPRKDVELRLASGLFEVMTTGLSVRNVAYTPLVTVHATRLTGTDLLMKTALDYIIAGAVVVFGAPLYLLLGLLVKLDSPGPALHRRTVLGRGGEPFDCFKLRTMRTDGNDLLSAEQQAHLGDNHKLKDDPRVTRLGRVLRKTSLDELPQMFNVLLGQMSVVGPRMISPEEHSKYGRWDLNLLTVKPGITGLWQVSGRSETSYEERVQLDMNYIRNWTIWLDLQLLVQTIPAVLRGRGAY